MSENNNVSAEEKLKGIEELLETYRNQLRLTVTSNSKVNDYMNLSQIELKALSGEDCDEISYVLSQHCLYVQNEINRNTGIYKWADRNILGIITGKVDNYGDQYTPGRHKEMRAILENPLAKELYKIKSMAENNLSVLEDIPRRLDTMVQSFRDAKQSKRRQ